jgi:hypothetical protein
MNTVPTIRYLSPNDNLSIITDLVHAAYASRAEANLKYWATHQSIQDTAKRFSLGQGFIAELNGRIVGTLMARPPQADSTVPLYRSVNLACCLNCKAAALVADYIMQPLSTQKFMAGRSSP